MSTYIPGDDYKALLAKPYDLKPGEVRMKVRGTRHDMCPDDGCTILNEKHKVALGSVYLGWSPDGHVTVRYKNKNGARRTKSLHLYIWEILEGRTVGRGKVLHHMDKLRYNNNISNLKEVTHSTNNSDNQALWDFIGLHGCQSCQRREVADEHKRRQDQIHEYI